MTTHPMPVIKAAWRRIRRPSLKTIETFPAVPVLADAETCPKGEDTTGEARESTNRIRERSVADSRGDREAS